MTAKTNVIAGMWSNVNTGFIPNLEMELISRGIDPYAPITIDGAASEMGEGFV